ncbi:hypothetical protein S40293_04253 [Stachybotrys chartarum IBT 40293]|nr:hypothetical protein S40293_04253 [Stachybotrys chartarum IBT 40293]
MASLKMMLAGVAMMATRASAQETDDMGPAAFLWPEDRVWQGDWDNRGPCGSVAEPHNRTEFPMQSGQVALVAQDDSYDITLSISYSDDPQSNDDFETLIDAEHMRELDPGHVCVNLLDAPSSVSAGDNATIQIRYTAQFDNPQNETFYACADIVWVDVAHFTGVVPCFNATDPGAGDADWYHDPNNEDEDEDEDENEDDDDEDDDDDASSGSDGALEGNGDESSSNDNNGSGSGLSGGAIAGIVVGSLAGVGLIVAAGLVVYRRKQQRLRALRQQHSSRGVDWEAQPGKSTASTDSVRMENLS